MCGRPRNPDDSHDASHDTGATMSRDRLRSLLLATTGLTYVLLLIGIYTAASGAGLTCAGRWPLCDGAVFGLFPANWPSFIEWFHRLIAMIAGFVVIGATYGAWRWQDGRRIRLAMTTALALYPVQALLGAGTVLDYSLFYLTAHFLTALTIFGSLVLATLWYVADIASIRRVRSALFVAVGLFPVLVALSPGTLVDHTAAVQAIYYAIGLALFATLLAAAVWSGLLEATASRLSRVRLLAGVGAATLAAQLLLGRYVYTDLIQLLDATAMAAAFLIAVAAAWLTARIEPAAASPQAQ
ncbi:cytochrome-c-aa3 oxidase assembly factor CtaA [Halalkalicoccus jeotgali B3]|uniref:Cytochrome-c-aa3 oxidase assembly factor CtaA n=2 Tax=Halalkalicoccus jeotgali (strain DSM 18796 / CECT 7217 / JCM 14584 / KCTC 4019 / B3) TaxID=795797 RepID=L9VQN7_HALJB|nr:cytochrome-c-aa3 oxidase assembly factor CtaA [Halalkalicoccus jeotgali B3]